MNKYYLKLDIDNLPLIGKDELIPFIFGYLYECLSKLSPESLDAELSTFNNSEYIIIYSNTPISKTLLNDLVSNDKVTLLYDGHDKKVLKGELFEAEFSKNISESELLNKLTVLDRSINKDVVEVAKELRKSDRANVDNLSAKVSDLESKDLYKKSLVKSSVKDLDGYMASRLIKTSPLVERLKSKADRFLVDKFNGLPKTVDTLSAESGNTKVSKLKEFSDRLRSLKF